MIFAEKPAGTMLPLPVNFKLPKGYKWSMGRKFKLNRANGELYIASNVTFLPIGDDLYISGMKWFKHYKIDPPGDCILDFWQENKSKKGVIHNYKSLTANQVIQANGYLILFWDCILDFWHEENLPLGYVIPMTRELKI